MSKKRPIDDLAKKIAKKEKTLKVVTQMVNKSRTDPKLLTQEEIELIEEIKEMKGMMNDEIRKEIPSKKPKKEEEYIELEIIDDQDEEDEEDDENEMTPFAEQLLREGYTVIPVYTQEETKLKRKEFHNTLMTKMPEYRHNKTTKEVNTFKGEHYFHKGGFGALGNPSSFHNIFARKVRMDAMDVAKNLFDSVRHLDPTLKNHKLEQIIDRMRVLRKKADLTAETWHRDTTPLFEKTRGFGAESDDKIYGGWIAFDGPQKFSAVKQTHTTNNLVPTGFSKLSKEDQVKLTNEKNRIIKEKGEKEWYIYIPAGHMLIFQQEMIHEVEKGDKKQREQPSYRLFTGWRLTKSKKPLMPNQDEFFSKQTVPLIKSSQEADMWPQAAWSTQAAMKTLQEWSEATFNPIFLYNRPVQGGEFAGATWHIIPRYMYSMYDVARKLAVKHIINTMKNINEKIPKILRDAIELHPDEWKQKWNDEELEYYIGLDEESIRSFMFPPYSKKEKKLYKPVN